MPLISNLQQRDLLFSIGAIRMRLVCRDMTVIRKLEKRFEKFLLLGSPEHTVYINIGSLDLKDVDARPEYRYKNNSLWIRGKKMEGYFDEIRCMGELSIPDPPDISVIEYYIRSVIALLAFRSGAILFHSAGVVREKYAYLFFGHSGCGKSTVVRYSTNDTILNDDLLLLEPSNGCWIAYATPFSNPGRIVITNTNACVVGMFRLIKNNSVVLERTNPSIALAEVISNVPVIPVIPNGLDELIKRCWRLTSEIPVYNLYFRKDPTFWEEIERLNLQGVDGFP